MGWVEEQTPLFRAGHCRGGLSVGRAGPASFGAIGELLSSASQNSARCRETEVGLELPGRIKSKICFSKILSFERLGQISVGLFEQHNKGEREND